MQPLLRSILRSLVAGLLGLVLATSFAGCALASPLDDYVSRPDPAYRYELVETQRSFGFTNYILRLTSQQWRSASEVDSPLWTHWLIITVPVNLDTNTALLVIDGGGRRQQPPDPDLTLSLLALGLQSVVVDLQQVPNQPLLFAEESRQRSEDEILAYSWDKYLRTGDPTWIVHLPMTKAAVRAMDAVQQFLAQKADGAVIIEDFIVTGGSKRGWTAWLTAAVDSRVRANIPLVIDLLNMEPSLQNHFQAYGFWSPAIQAYVDTGIFGWIGSPQLASLVQIVDPFTYRERLALPKYIINSAGDQFFTPDSALFYFDELPGTRLLRYVPNTDHSLDEPSVITSASAFFLSIVRNDPLPSISWEFSDPATIVVRTEDNPAQVRLWQAYNPSARDFRLETIGKAWQETELNQEAPGQYRATVEIPERGWRAFFIELTFPTSSMLPLIVTTPVRVVPQTYPHPPPLVTTHSASGHPIVAPSAIASLWGTNLSSNVASAQTVPLPETLADVELRIRDASGLTYPALLFFVSPSQINYYVPENVAPGVGRIELLKDGEVYSWGQILIDPYAPGIFSANGDGRGVAAGVALAVHPDGSTSTAFLFDPAQPPGQRTAVPVSVSNPGDQLYLIPFGTGMRHFRGSVEATVGRVPVPVIGPAAHGFFVGLDQVNLGPIPYEQLGPGEHTILLKFGSKTTNPVTAAIQ